MSALRRITIILGLLLSLSIGAMAQSGQVSETRKQVVALNDKYSEVKGFDSITAVKGDGLELIKLFMRKEFGKDFLKGINIIIMLDYSAASKSDAERFRKEALQLKPYFNQEELPEELFDSETGRPEFLFKMDAQDEYITDLLILGEESDSRVMVYFGGKMSGLPDEN